MPKKISNKGGAPKKHYEEHYEMNPRSQAQHKRNPQNDFDPRSGKERRKLYNKVNETDH